MAMRSDSSERLRRAARSIALTRCGLLLLFGAVLSLVAAHVFTIPAFNYVASLLIGLVICSAIFVLAGHSRVRIDRSFSPEIVRPGQPATATVAFVNFSVLPTAEAHWHDVLPPHVRGEAQGELRSLGGGGGAGARTKFSYTLRGVRRGRHAIGPLTVEMRDPFALVVRRHIFGDAQHLIILPASIELAEIGLAGTHATGTTRPAPRHIGAGDDDIIARNYYPGDALRRMHWKATAHRGHLMVRQEEQHNNPEATVLLDLDPAGWHATPPRRGGWAYAPSFEWAVIAAASIAAHLSDRGYLVNVIAPGGPLNRWITDGEDTLEDVMIDLALIEPLEIEVRDITCATVGEGMVIAILGALDEPRARAWAGLSGSAGIAFIARDSSEAALEILEDAGWVSHRYAVGDDLAALWLDQDARNPHAAR